MTIQPQDSCRGWAPMTTALWATPTPLTTMTATQIATPSDHALSSRWLLIATPRMVDTCAPGHCTVAVLLPTVYAARQVWHLKAVLGMQGVAP